MSAEKATRCFEGMHLAAFVVAAPVGIALVLGVPMYFTWLLVKNRHRRTKISVDEWNWYHRREYQQKLEAYRKKHGGHGPRRLSELDLAKKQQPSHASGAGKSNAQSAWAAIAKATESKEQRDARLLRSVLAGMGGGQKDADAAPVEAKQVEVEPTTATAGPHSSAVKPSLAALFGAPKKKNHGPKPGSLAHALMQSAKKAKAQRAAAAANASTSGPSTLAVPEQEHKADNEQMEKKKATGGSRWLAAASAAKAGTGARRKSSFFGAVQQIVSIQRAKKQLGIVKSQASTGAKVRVRGAAPLDVAWAKPQEDLPTTLQMREMHVFDDPRFVARWGILYRGCRKSWFWVRLLMFPSSITVVLLGVLVEDVLLQFVLNGAMYGLFFLLFTFTLPMDNMLDNEFNLIQADFELMAVATLFFEADDIDTAILVFAFTCALVVLQQLILCVFFRRRLKGQMTQSRVVKLKQKLQQAKAKENVTKSDRSAKPSTSLDSLAEITNIHGEWESDDDDDSNKEDIAMDRLKRTQTTNGVPVGTRAKARFNAAFRVFRAVSAFKQGKNSGRAGTTAVNPVRADETEDDTPRKAPPARWAPQPQPANVQRLPSHHRPATHTSHLSVSVSRLGGGGDDSARRPSMALPSNWAAVHHHTGTNTAVPSATRGNTHARSATVGHAPVSGHTEHIGLSADWASVNTASSAQSSARGGVGNQQRSTSARSTQSHRRGQSTDHRPALRPERARFHMSDQPRRLSAAVHAAHQWERFATTHRASTTGDDVRDFVHAVRGGNVGNVGGTAPRDLDAGATTVTLGGSMAWGDRLSSPGSVESFDPRGSIPSDMDMEVSAPYLASRRRHVDTLLTGTVTSSAPPSPAAEIPEPSPTVGRTHTVLVTSPTYPGRTLAPSVAARGGVANPAGAGHHSRAQTLHAQVYTPSSDVADVPTLSLSADSSSGLSSSSRSGSRSPSPSAAVAAGRAQGGARKRNRFAKAALSMFGKNT